MARPKGKAHLTKAVLASDLSDLLNLPRGKHGKCPKGLEIVNTILRVIIEALRRGESVSIQGLGRFQRGWTQPIFFPVTIEPKFNGIRTRIPIPRRPIIRFHPSPSIKRDR